MATGTQEETRLLQESPALFVQTPTLYSSCWATFDKPVGLSGLQRLPLLYRGTSRFTWRCASMERTFDDTVPGGGGMRDSLSLLRVTPELAGKQHSAWSSLVEEV